MLKLALLFRCCARISSSLEFLSETVSVPNSSNSLSWSKGAGDSEANLRASLGFWLSMRRAISRARAFSFATKSKKHCRLLLMGAMIDPSSVKPHFPLGVVRFETPFDCVLSSLGFPS